MTKKKPQCSTKHGNTAYERAMAYKQQRSINKDSVEDRVKYAINTLSGFQEYIRDDLIREWMFIRKGDYDE